LLWEWDVSFIHKRYQWKELANVKMSLSDTGMEYVQWTQADTDRQTQQVETRKRTAHFAASDTLTV